MASRPEADESQDLNESDLELEGVESDREGLEDLEVAVGGEEVERPELGDEAQAGEVAAQAEPVNPSDALGGGHPLQAFAPLSPEAEDPKGDGSERVSLEVAAEVEVGDEKGEGFQTPVRAQPPSPASDEPPLMSPKEMEGQVVSPAKPCLETEGVQLFLQRAFYRSPCGAVSFLSGLVFLRFCAGHSSP